MVETEVCVVGGGPAGSTIARQLRMLGHEVVLIERASRKRIGLGHSLPPRILPLLDALDLRRCIEDAGFLRTSGYVRRWEGTASFHSWAAGDAGFQVDRARFDQLLLNVATRDGVQVLKPALALQPVYDEDGWKIPVMSGESGEVMQKVRARFLVLAGGRRSGLNGLRVRTSEPTTALCANFLGVSRLHGESHVDATDDAWLWGAANGDGSLSAAVFVDPRYCRRIWKGDVGALFDSVVAESAVLSALVGSGTRSRVVACSASSYVTAKECISHTLLRVGDASLAIDPLSSQGVQAALQSALQGALAAHTILDHPAQADAAIEFYRARQQESKDHHLAWASDLYSVMAVRRQSAFWLARSRGRSELRREAVHASGISPARPLPKMEAPVALSSEARIVQTPVVNGAYIKRVIGVEHPALRRPLVYVDGSEVGSLVAEIVPGQSVRQTLTTWGKRLDPHLTLRLFRWLFDNGVINELQQVEG